MTGLQLTAVILSAIGATAVSAIFIWGLWKLARAPRARDYVAKPRDLVRGRRFPLALARATHNPVLPPTPLPWEAAAVLNPAVIEHGGRVHLFYRAIGMDGVSRIGYASSGDGVHFDERLPYPVFAVRRDPRSARMRAHDPRMTQMYLSGGSWSGVEDPRASIVGGRLYLTFNAFEGWNAMRIGSVSISLDDLDAKRWHWSAPNYLSPPDEIHKNWVIFPRKINGRFAILHSISPKPEVAFVDDIDAVGSSEQYIKSTQSPRVAGNKDGWETRVRGAGPPPIETKDGWLVLYHAHDEDQSRYKLGAMLLDLDDPMKVIARARLPVLEPEGDFENGGAKPGVVYACGAVVRDGMLHVYYGGADNFVCMAAAPIDAFVASIKDGAKPLQLSPVLKQEFFIPKIEVAPGIELGLPA